MQDYVLISIPEDRIRIIVKQAVEAALSESPKVKSVTAQDAPLITKVEAARLISVCQSTIDNAARDGRLKRHYVGKSVRFDREQVLKLAKSNSNHKINKI